MATSPRPSSSDDSTGDLLSVIAERDALLQNDVDTWLTQVKQQSASYLDFEKSISWQATKPVRWAGAFVRKARSDGLADAVGYAMAVVRSRIARR